MQQVEGVATIVDEVDARIAGNSNAKEAACSRSAGVVNQFVGDLAAAGSGLNDVAIVAVSSQDIAFGSNGESKRIVDPTARSHFIAGTGAARAGKRIWNSVDAAVCAIGHIKRIIRRQTYTGWADDESGRVGTLSATRANDRGTLPDRHSIALPWSAENDANDRPFLDDLPIRGDSAVQHIGNKEHGHLVEIKRCHIPWAINDTARERLDCLTIVIQYDQATCFCGCRHAIRSGQAAHNYPASLEYDERGGQTNTTRTGPWQFSSVDPREEADLSRGGNLHNSGTRPLQAAITAIIVEVADQNITLNQIPNRFWHYDYPVGILVSISRYG